MSKEPKRNVYVGHRYVPLVIGEWDKTETYEGLSIVTNKGTSYTSKKRVPKGIDILNEEYWVVTGNYNAQIEEYRKDVRSVKNDIKEVDEKLTKQAEQTAVHLADYAIDGVLDHGVFVELLSTSNLFLLNEDVTIKPVVTHELLNDVTILSYNHSKLFVDGINEIPLIQTKGSFTLNNVHLSGRGLIVYGNLTDQDVIEKISFKNNTIGGNRNDSIKPLHLTTERDFNPLNGFFGVKTIEIVDNHFIDLYSNTGRPFEVRDICWDFLLFKHNRVQNFFPRIVDGSTNNNHSFSSEMSQAHGTFEGIGNTIINDDSFKPYDLYPSNNATYYSPVIIQSVKAIYQDNTINGMHYIQRDGETAPNVYSAYLSSNDVIWKNNEFKNVMLFSDSKFYGDLFKSKFGEGIRIYEDNIVDIEDSYYDRLNVSSYGVSKNSMWSSIFGFQGDMGDVHFNRNTLKIPRLKILKSYFDHIKNLYFNDNVFEIKNSEDTIFFGSISDRTESIEVKNNKVKSEDVTNTDLGLLAINTSLNKKRLIQIKHNTFENVTVGRIIWKYSELPDLNETVIQITDNDFLGLNNTKFGLTEHVYFNTLLFESNHFNGTSLNESSNVEFILANSVLGSLPDNLYLKNQFFKKWTNSKWYEIRIPRQNMLPNGTEMLGTLELKSSKQHGTYRLEFEGTIQDGVFELSGDIGVAVDGVVDEDTQYTNEKMIFDGSGNIYTNKTLENKGSSMAILSNQLFNGSTRMGIGLRFETNEPVHDVELSLTIVKK